MRPVSVTIKNRLALPYELKGIPTFVVVSVSAFETDVRGFESPDRVYIRSWEFVYNFYTK
jgi:hypothetical protein